MLSEEILVPERRGIPRGKAIIAAIAGLAMLAGVVGWQVLHRATPAQQYVTAPVERTDLADTVAATGPVVAATAVPVNFKESGKVAEIDVRVGDRVQVGQVLAKLDPSDLQLALEQAQANRDAAQANYQKLIEGPQPADVQSAQAAIDAATHQQENGKANLTATQKQITRDAGVAQAAVSSARTNLTLAQGALDAARKEVAKTLAADETAVANAQKNLDTVRAAVAANGPVLAQAVEKARDDLWAAQTSRDGICGRSQGAECQAANASVGGAQTAVNSAEAQETAGEKQGAQQIAEAEASLRQAQAQLASDQARENAAQATAAGQVKQAQDALSSAERNAADAEAKGELALQTAQAQVNTATSAQESARAAYAKAVAPPTAAEIANAKAQVAAQQAQVDQAQANLAAATLRAPSAGVVTAIDGAVGQWLTGGSTSGAAASAASGANNSSSNSASSFISLTDLSHLQIQAQVNEADVGRVAEGQGVSFTVDAFPNQTFHGKVSVVEPLGSTNQNVVTYPVLIAIDPTPTRLLPGMTANLTITVSQRPNVLVVPAAALSFAQAQVASGNTTAGAAGGSSVLVVGSDGTARVQPIQTGVTDGEETEVLSGLRDGERVAVGLKGR